jgi:hypothetical protein
LPFVLRLKPIHRRRQRPVRFHWPIEAKRDFWCRVADEMPVTTAYLGEVVCAKREPFFTPHLEAIVEHLTRASKRVVWLSLAQLASAIDRKASLAAADFTDAEIEANAASVLPRLKGRPHRIGQFLNVYNGGGDQPSRRQRRGDPGRDDGQHCRARRKGRSDPLRSAIASALFPLGVYLPGAALAEIPATVVRINDRPQGMTGGRSLEKSSQNLLCGTTCHRPQYAHTTS